MSFISSNKPLSEWKWYIRARDFSIHQSPDPIEDATEISPPPGREDQYTWDWQNNKWALDVLKMKRISVIQARNEFDRLNKFNDLEPAEKRTIQTDLAAYRNELRLFIKNFNPENPLPSAPESLSDENFYNL